MFIATTACSGSENNKALYGSVFLRGKWKYVRELYTQGTNFLCIQTLKELKEIVHILNIKRETK